MQVTVTLFTVLLLASTASAREHNFCNTKSYHCCQLQLDNVEVLEQLIDSKIEERLLQYGM